MTIMGKDPRGAFRVIELDASKGQGVQVSIAGASTVVGDSSLVTSFSVQQGENIAVSQCLNGGIYLYTFGHDPQRSQFNVSVTSFLNACNGSAGAAIAEAIAAYQAGRVSVSKAISSLSIGKGSCKGYLIGQGIDVVDPQLCIVNTTYNFIALDAHGG